MADLGPLALALVLVVAAVVALNAWASSRVTRDELSSQAKKAGQLALVWCAPIIGALLVIRLLSDNATRSSGQYPIEHQPPDDFGGSGIGHRPDLGTRQYARIVDGWVEAIGLDPTAYGTHSMRRTKPTLIYRRTKNIRAVQLLLGHSKLESTVRYLGIEVDDAREMAEQTEV